MGEGREWRDGREVREAREKGIVREREREIKYDPEKERDGERVTRN